MIKRSVRMLGLVAAGSLAGCSVGYYWQATVGHLRVMDQRQPVEEVLQAPDTSPELRERLRMTSEILDFAHAELALPDNGSYRQYADIGRDYVVWNVFAAPPLSLELRRWCHPVAGCVSYRGYYKAQSAHDFAERLAGQGDDVFVGGAAAYSTLGHFRDPLLSTMLDMPDHRLAGLLFHELAHQRLYVKGDTTLNESFASAVEQAGLHLWFERRGEPQARCAHETWTERRRAVAGLYEVARRRLDRLYQSDRPEAAKLAAKREILDQLRADYRRIRSGWGGPPFFDGWFGDRLNNAMLGALATYDSYVPAMLGLLAEEDGDFERFYQRVEALARLSEAERRERLDAVAPAPVAAEFSENCARPRRSPGSLPD